MPKHSNSSKIEHYKKKIRRLEKRQARSIISDSSDSEENQDASRLVPEYEQGIFFETQPLDQQANLQQIDTQYDYEIQAGPSHQDASQVEQTNSPVPEPLLDPLDPEVLSALGDCLSDSVEFGDIIHDNLAKLWTPLLKRGLSKEERDKLNKEYLIPDNCRLLQAPKLNAEISSAIAESARFRDKKYAVFQQQLGHGITAANRAMDLLLKNENKLQSLKYLSDSCRILSDLHFSMSKDRTKLITPGLDKNFMHIISDSERDETLFGKNLPDKIKASKAIEKQGQLIKKNANAVKYQGPPIPRPMPLQGNWQGPPRFSSNRGGRGMNRKMNSFPPRHQFLPTQSRPSNQGKPRANLQHR